MAFDLSQIFRNAWREFRRHVGRTFGYWLEDAWYMAKLGKAAEVAKTERESDRRRELVAEAGRLNNHPALVNVDHVTFMAFLELEECERHVAKLRDMTRPALDPAKVRRAEQIRAELVDQEFADYIDWPRRRALQAELAAIR